jgi:mRNA interferase RelE/StbE
MKARIDKSFSKDIQKIKDNKLLLAIAECIETVQKTDKISSIVNCKKLKGSTNAYRIRLGEYRIGFVFEEEYIDFVRFLHRSKVYDVFP